MRSPALSDSTTPNIPKAAKGHNRRAEFAPRVPTRDELRGSSVEVLRSGRFFKADLLRVDLGHGPLLVKDYGRHAGLSAWLGRLQIARELRAYRWLGRLEGIPSLVGRVDARALAVEWIDGEPLATVPDRVVRGRHYVDRLAAVVARLHERGVAHLDLRSNKNVMVARDGQVVVVDLASAMCFRSGGLLHRWWFPLLRANDRTALVKWKQTLDAGPLTEEERTLLRRHGRLRPLWLINRKQRRQNRRML